ncbi:hypothetical protein [Paenibacillus agricola]|uniref:Uncharacterized protein n=1 Tax=Paenibacillus agricola TaxID=2716264 RepID=A0ABX0JA48_9BACL|nr:hypothetical protein [Paenibacillus agricola]NHN30851.1 hypothetical protein [Paenibacillus agricola]
MAGFNEWLGEPELLKKRLVAMAIIELIVCDQAWLRYHSFAPLWSPGISAAKVDNGSGDELFVIFAADGVILKGFDHESGLSPHAREEFEVWPGIYDEVPPKLLGLLNDEAFEQDHVTFCLWREAVDTKWRSGQVDIPTGMDDGAGWLLGTLYAAPEPYVEWANDYFEMELHMEMVKRIYAGEPIEASIIQTLNPERNVEDALRELRESGLV